MHLKSLSCRRMILHNIKPIVEKNSTEWIKTRTADIRRIDLPRRADPRTETDYGIRSKRWI